MVLNFSLVRRILSRFTGRQGASDLTSYSSPVNLIEGVVPTCAPNFGTIFFDVDITMVFFLSVAEYLMFSIGLDEASCAGRWSHPNFEFPS